MSFLKFSKPQNQEPWETGLEYSVPKSDWEDDKESSTCSGCHSKFTVVIRKHHCRRCGLLVCDRCSIRRLSLPGYDHEERVCSPCFTAVVKLRDFVNKYADAMVSNAKNKTGAGFFSIYSMGQPAYKGNVWLSQTMLMVMYETSDGKISGYPAANLAQVTEGYRSDELKSRLKSTVFCCIPTTNPEYVGKDNQFLSLHFRDGRTLDLQASSTSIRDSWHIRFSALLQSLQPFAEYHTKRGRVDEKKLIAMEEARIKGRSAAGNGLSLKAAPAPSTARSPSSSSSSSSASGSKGKSSSNTNSARIKDKYQRLKD